MYAVSPETVAQTEQGLDRFGARLVSDLLDRSAERFPARPAMDFLGRRWTYAELRRAVDRVAAGLQEMDVAKGDRVGLCLPNTPFFVIAYFAILKVGAVVVNYNPLYVERELEHQIRDSGTSVMFVVDLVAIYRKVADVAARTGLRKIVVCCFAEALPATKGVLFRALKRRDILSRLPDDGRHVRFSSLLACGTLRAPVIQSEDDVAVLQYTGGTTGVPKGAMLTHRNVVANCAQASGMDASRKMGTERIFGVLPFFHVFAMTAVMNYGITIAAELILLPRYELQDTLAALVRTRPTILPAVPTIYGALAALAKAKRRDLSFIELCLSGGAPLSPEVADQFCAATGARLIEAYGLTEAAPGVTCTPPTGRAKAGSVGLALVDTIIEIRNPATRALMPTGEKGEIVVRGPQVMAGYWNKPEATADALDEHGLRTGDIGYLDEDGYLFIVDRMKDVILCGGYNVYPRAIEDALYQHEAVAEAVAIGIPDAYRGQAPKAFVVLRAGHTATADGLRAFLENYLSKIERPKEIEIRTSLPKTAVGKLSKKELVAEETARAAARASPS